MKKTLIALAALSACGAAMAQSNVAVYGVVDTAVSYLKGQNSFTGLNSGGNATSRLGFKGAEDLGGGMKANFQLEAGIKADVGSGASGYVGASGSDGLAFKRISTVGLSGGFGEVRLGREKTAAYKAVGDRYDPFGAVGYGGSNLWNDGGGATGGGDIPANAINNPVITNERVGNAVTYFSPNIAGFQVSGNYGFGEVAGNQSAGRFLDLAATYDNGPLSLGLGWERWDSTIVNGVQTVTGGPNSGDMTSWTLGGSYDFGVAQILAGYRESNTDHYNGTLNKNKFKGYMLAATAPAGPGQVRAAYTRYQDAFQGSTDKVDQFALGYIYNLSKRTALYGTYAYFKNKNPTLDIPGLDNLGGGVALKSNGSEQGLQLGITHTF